MLVLLQLTGRAPRWLIKVGQHAGSQIKSEAHSSAHFPHPRHKRRWFTNSEEVAVMQMTCLTHELLARDLSPHAQASGFQNGAVDDLPPDESIKHVSPLLHHQRRRWSYQLGTDVTRIHLGLHLWAAGGSEEMRHCTVIVILMNTFGLECLSLPHSWRH